MFNKTDKRRVCELMDMYLSDKITAAVFCDEYYYWFNLEVDMDTLTDLEKRVFTDLNQISSRFSPFKEDIEKYPGTYFSERELNQKILDTKNILNRNSG